MERPEIIVNIACSLDGIVASSKGSLNLSDNDDWKRVHELRNSVDAILVGANTILSDNPMLTVREIAKRKKSLFRIILDTNCKIPVESNVFKDQKEYPTIVFCSSDCEETKIRKFESMGVRVLKVQTDVNGFLNVQNILHILYSSINIKKLLIEGGPTVITQFFKSHLIDKMFIFYSPIFLHTSDSKTLIKKTIFGTNKKPITVSIDEISQIGSGFLISLKFNWSKQNVL
jgi:riboflavin-specific deaminase-like protein